MKELEYIPEIEFEYAPEKNNDKWEFEKEYLSLRNKIAKSENFCFKFPFASMVVQPMSMLVQAMPEENSRQLIIYEQFLKKEFNGFIPFEKLIGHNFNVFKFLNNNFKNIQFKYFIEGGYDFLKEFSSTHIPIITCVIIYKNIYFKFHNRSIYILHTDISKVYQQNKNIVKILTQYNYTERKKNNINIVTTHSSGSFSLSDFEINFKNFNLNKNYNDDFIEVDKVIKKSLENSSKGIILLHGEMGSGKTFYIRNLIKSVNKKFIFIPSHLTNRLSETSFMTFLISRCKNSVLILEDCEKLLASRENKNFSEITDILNIADGIMNDVLKIQFICTFNTKVSNIDAALMRDGRLIAEYHFDKLTYEKSLECAKNLNKELKEEKKYTLAEIYNLNEIIPRANKKEKK